MNKIRIYLDDVRVPKSKVWTLVKSYDEFVTLVNQYGLENIETISLDHDLGIGAMSEWYRSHEVDCDYVINYDNIKEKTGYDAAKFLVELSMDTNIHLPLIYVHSANTTGSENIIKYINNYLKHCGLVQTCVWLEQPFIIPNNLFH